MLVAPGLAHKDDGVAMCGEAVAREVDVVADALRGVAVVAHAIEAAGGVTSQAGGVDGGSDVAGSSKCCFDSGSNLVQSDDMYHVVRAPSDGGDAVAASVDVDDNAILGDGVSAGEEVVHIHSIEIALALLLGGNRLIAVDDLIGATIDEFARQPHLADGLRAAPGDAAALGHDRLYELDGLSGSGAVVRREISAFQVLDDAPRQQFVMNFNRCHNYVMNLRGDQLWQQYLHLLATYFYNSRAVH